MAEVKFRTYPDLAEHIIRNRKDYAYDLYQSAAIFLDKLDEFEEALANLKIDAEYDGLSLDG